MSQSFSSQLDLKLIHLVKNNPVLYNPRHPKYSDSDTREVTWQKISDALNKPTAEFAGIQCHIQFGDYNEEKHKPGFIENLNEYLPSQYCSSWGIEKKILKEYSSHIGLTELDAKHLYTKTARELPTYGVTFFLVKEKQKGKNKLVPRLLGINADAILRLDENTKEILQQWPLTHVKTYHAGRGETFTLNFGDYVDKEYSVKTRDAFRIRDILEGYIDLIRKRMLANYNQRQTETGYVSMDNISSGQASMVQHVSSGPMKVVEQTYVGPCKIVSYEPGQTPNQGTQTTHQVVVSDLINKQGQGVKGEIPMRKDMGIPFTRRLNRLNSNSVKIVTLLTEPSKAHIEDAKKIVDDMNADMPFVRDGVQETMTKQPNEEEKKKLRDQLHELDELLKLLAKNTEPNDANPCEAEEVAKQIADLTTQMYFAVAPETKRRSRIISKSRKSFIEDDRTENSLRRPSFIAATAGAIHALDSTGDILNQGYKGPALTPQQVEELEKAAIDKLGRINAAIAHYMLAHSDPQNIDYGAAVNSLNTIHELTPELAKDGQALASVRDGVDRSELLDDIKDLCAAAKHVCSLSGVEDTESSDFIRVVEELDCLDIHMVMKPMLKLQEATAKYADVAGKLVYVFGRSGKGAKARADKENEIVDLAKDVGAKASLLLMSAQALTETAAGEPGAEHLDAVGARTATAAKDLLAQAELNAPTIQEPHCQSALTAAAEALSSSAQHLGAAWKPLVEPPERHELGEKLHNRSMDLARALDRLQQAYADLEEEEDPFSEGGQTAKPASDAPKLKFINTLARARGNMQAAQDDLNKPLSGPVDEEEAKNAEQRLAQRLAQLNAALAALLGATADRSNPDFATADSAIATINELMPEVVKDSKIATANKEEESRKALLDNIKDLCAVSQNVCASAYGADPEDLNDAVSKYGAASGKMSYVLNRRVTPKKEEQIKEEAALAVNDAGEVLEGVQDLEAAGVGGRELEAKRAALADALKALLTTAKLTSPSISDPRCQSTLLASIDKVSGAGDDLAEAWAPLAADPAHAKRLQALQDALDRLRDRLGKIRTTCQLPETEEEIAQACQMAQVQDVEDGPQQQKKLQFVMRMNGAKGKLAEAQNELKKPTLLAKGADANKVQDRLSQGLAQLNAAIAALLNATSDRDKPDYEAAEQAADTIAKLMPQVIQDTKTVSTGKDAATRDAMLAQVKELCDASEGMCASFGSGKPEDLNDAVAKLTNASSKLVYVVGPRVNPQKEENVIALSRGVCGATSSLLSGVQQLAGAVDGARGEALDREGARVADTAQALLQTAQLTAPSLSSPACQQELLSSIDGLAGASQQLDAALQPLKVDPRHGAQAKALHHAVQQLDKDLDILRDTCQAPDLVDSPQKLQFIKTMRGTTEKLGDAQKQLSKPAPPAKGADAAEVQQRLAKGLAQLNAAIAALLNATADREKPDYAVAEKAASTIANLMPHVIQDTKTVSAGKDAATRDAMLAQVKELCDASEGMCASFESGKPEDLNDAVAKLTNASGKLVYVVGPRVNPQKEENVIALSSGVCGATSSLLSDVQQLAGEVGGARGEALDREGGRVADAAQALLQTAQLTAPTLSSPTCQQALLLSVDGLEGTSQQLDAALQPLHVDPRHGAKAKAVHHALQKLDKKLDILRDACQAPDSLDSPQKLQFIKTMRGTTEKLGDAQKQLSKPALPVKGADAAEVQQRLSKGLAQLNAAIAALLNATADREKPDYAVAEKAASTIASLMPNVIQDTKTVSAGKDAATRDAMLAQVKELCDASEGMCASFESGKPEDLNDAVAKLTNASGKLLYVVSPRVNPQKEENVIALSSGVCGATSSLLSGVQQLVGEVGDTRGEMLDREGGRVADAAQALLQTAQLTAPTLSSQPCKQALLSSVDGLTSASQQLNAALQPLHVDPHHGTKAKTVHHALQHLDKKLDILRDACQAPDLVDSPQKLQFIKTMRGTTEKLGDAQKQLSKPAAPAKGADAAEVQQRLAKGLAQLNAAIAALLNATADREKPDYAVAEKAASTIANLMPHVIQDTKTVSAGKDAATRDAMLAQVKELCDASEGMCASFESGKPEDLNDAVAKLTNASGKLVYVVGPRVNPQKEENVIALSRGVCGATSSLLSGVQQLAGAVDGARGEALDREGARVADAAQALLQTAQLTAPSLSSPACQQELLSSVDGLTSAGQQLDAALQPLHVDPRYGAQAKTLHCAVQQLDKELESLRDACQAPDTVDTPQKLHFIKSIQGAKGKVEEALKSFDEPALLTKGTDVIRVQNRLSQGLAQLNAAMAALLNATADREKPDYEAAETAATVIADLIPQVLQDAKAVKAATDQPTRVAMVAQIEKLCEASQDICTGFENGNPEVLNDAVAKYTDASGKLVYMVSLKVNPDRENKIIALSSGVCGTTSSLLSGVQQLAGVVGGARGEALDREGGRVADAAQALLQTAQITAPSMSSPECQKELLTSIDSLSGSGKQLASCLGPLQEDSQHKQQAQSALEALQRLEGQMDELRKTCQKPDLPEDPQKLQFFKTLEDAKGKWVNAQKELKKPPAPARGANVDGIQLRLAQRLAELNAAVAALLSGTADPDKPRYAEAERSVHTISDLLPQVIQDTKTVSASKDAATRDAMLAQVKELCDASEGMCASFESGKPEDLTDAVAKYTESSGKLVYATSTAANPEKEEEIIALSSGVCGATTSLLSGVQQLAGEVGGASGEALDRKGGQVADAAQTLLQIAQITSPSMLSPKCQEVMISSADNLSSAGQQLSSTLEELHDSKHGQRARQLNQALQQLQEQLDALKRACRTHAGPAPPLPKTQPPVAHAVRKRSSADITQDFLDRVRCEESMAQSLHQPPPSPKPTATCPAVGTKVEKVKPPPPVRKTDDDKRLHQMFVATVEEAERSIKNNEAGLMKLCKSESSSGPALSQSEMMKKQQQLQHSLALAGVEVANLVAANYADKIDYTAASKSTKALPQIMNKIVEDGTHLSDNVNDMARKAFLYDMLQLCEASRKLCDSAKSDRQKLNEAAVNFGDTSTKLLYVVSSDVDPAAEKEIISRAKVIGDSASRLALDAAGVAAGGDTRGVCDAGAACADAAGKLVFTAKLTAPTIQEPRCQAALISSTDTLSTKLKTFADTWKPLASDPQQAKTVTDLSKEAANLERILEGLRSDVRSGIVHRREQEQLRVEDTPLRELTVRILDGAKSFAESPELQTGGKIEYAAYADRLRDALRELDLTAARCKKSPHDTNKRRELENAIQNLQMTLLQTRPKRGDKAESNIVDLRDFIEELSAQAKNMREASDVTVTTAHDKKALEDIKRKCEQIDTAACGVMTADEGSGMECTFGDILEVDQLGEQCDELIKKIAADLKGIEDAKAKRLLLPKTLPLIESCNMLRFATKSGISASACATLDSSLEDLEDIESRVIASIVRDAETKAVTLRSKPPLPTGDSPATIALCREVASPAAGVSARVVTAYIADAAARTDTANPDEKNKLLKHLYKLVHLLRTLEATSSKRAASWQTLDGPEVATLTEQIIQEIYNPESKFGVKTGETKQRILNESDIAKLLIPAAPKILGDKKQQEDKLVQLSSKLSSMCGLVSQGVTSPGALARSARTAADAAKELDGIARGVHITDNIQKKKIDETAKEMSFATYNVLKTAESACQDPNNSIVRRKLVTACTNLNKSIDKLVSNASTASALSQSVGALSRDAALQLSCLAPRACAPAPFNDTCDLLNKQADNINKLKSDEPMPRAEFMRNLNDIGSAVRTSTECASQCAYFIALSEKHKDIAKTGLVDVPQIQKSIESIQDSCMAIIGASQLERAKEQKEDLHRRVEDLTGALDKAHMLVKDGEVKRTLVRARSCVSDAASDLEDDLVDNGDMDKITPKAVTLLEAVNQAHCMIEKCPLVPMVGDMSPDTKARCDEVIGHSKTLLSNTLALLKDVHSTPEEEETLTWVTYSTSRKRLLEAYEALVKSVKKNGHRAGIYEKAPEEEDEEPVKKSYIEIQVDLANSWLKRPVCKPEQKAIGQQAVRNVVEVARQMSEDMKGSEREELRNAMADTEQLLCDCGKKYDLEKNTLLIDRLKELKKSIRRGVVTRVVEDFIEADAPLADLDMMADAETDESKRKFILERKIASLLAQLGRVTKTARFVAGASSHQAIGVEITQCSEQTELLAPMLVQAAQQRIDHPDDTVVIEKYKKLLTQYAESISKVRNLCDRAVDPMDFVQTAGDTMQRMREDMAQHNNDAQKCAYSSRAITKLANRVLHVGMSSPAVRNDAELQASLASAQRRLAAATPAPATRVSRLPDWRESTAELLRTAGDVESALGGENIFKREPTTANQPIYSVARSLHESVREWSARDNEIVAVARRMAVLMARLADYMHTDKQQALIATSKSIVLESHEVAELAKKLAHECSDVRIKTNLLQTCERIPTISGQLKMLTTVKGSSLGHQDSQADKEAMDMLVHNAQSLMMSIQEVVKAAAGASVKIMSQRGPRLRWVRKNFY